MSATTLTLRDGRYTVENESPKTGEFVRYLAFDTSDEADVSIIEVPLRFPKVQTSAQREAATAGFEKDASALVRLRHAALPSVRDFFSEGGRYFLVAERTATSTVSSVLDASSNGVEVEKVTDWADKLLDALDYLHTARPPFFHGSIEPGCLYLRNDGSVELSIEAVLARSSTSNPSRSAASDSPVSYSPLEVLWGGLDAASQKVITNTYDEASERILKQEPDARSDIYSLGATLYHLLTGRPPADALERSIEMIDGKPDPLRPPAKVNPSVPQEISDVVMKALEIKREYRFDSAAIMRQVLKTAVVRFKEREAEEARELDEALNDLRKAAASRHAPDRPEEEKPDEILKKLQEAEKARLEAEQRAIEAEKRLKETEVRVARATESFNLAELDDDLLGLLSPHNSEPPQAPAPQRPSTASSSEIIEQKPALEEPRTLAESFKLASQASDGREPAEVLAEPETLPVAMEAVDVEETPDSGPVTASAGFEKDEEFAAETKEDVAQEEPVTAFEEEKTASVASEHENVAKGSPALYDDPAPRSFAVSAPALAAVAVFIVIAGVGIWWMVGSQSAASPETQTVRPAQVQSSEVEQPQPPTASAFQPAGQPSPEPTTEAPGTSVSADETRQAAPAAQPKPKKQAQPAAKPPETKKKVTVDDLINDN